MAVKEVEAGKYGKRLDRYTQKCINKLCFLEYLKNMERDAEHREAGEGVGREEC